jgi:hypothetical protein
VLGQRTTIDEHPAQLIDSALKKNDIEDVENIFCSENFSIFKGESKNVI